ncbi:hypothetical protein JFL43_21895 [Viridibacillus sp. YIM B01967]|uniref:Replicative helicase inhibitor G39P N-terminal domain-containing protein n=1 Tax=Viridibacillus soli TaxID=2798301 RepID=A0ABS1HDF5_9BACL|nr:hypothetical protein [Viridibacillus soli]MBK3497415.1 hypothetical protein [Viridibacillus soli]
MTWEKQALEELVEQLVLHHQMYTKKMTVLEFLGIDFNWGSESFDIIAAMTPKWEECCKPPYEESLNKRYVEIVLNEIEKQYKSQ